MVSETGDMPFPALFRVLRLWAYFAMEIESAVTVVLFISPVTVTRYTDFLPVFRTSSAAFALPAESNLRLSQTGVTTAKVSSLRSVSKAGRVIRRAIAMTTLLFFPNSSGIHCLPLERATERRGDGPSVT